MRGCFEKWNYYLLVGFDPIVKSVNCRKAK